MDEPFSGLDSRLKDSVRAETLAILRESRATAIVVTHDAEEAMRMGDRIALLKDGRAGADSAPPRSFTTGRNSLFAAGFFSETQRLRGQGSPTVASPRRRSGRFRRLRATGRRRRGRRSRSRLSRHFDANRRRMADIPARIDIAPVSW
jgi:ABC-type Fe3+/spermidine/putrescine transport system ATPase subunit